MEKLERLVKLLIGTILIRSFIKHVADLTNTEKNFKNGARYVK